MFYRYSQYIMKTLAWSTLLITLSLTSIVWLTQSLRFIDFIVNQGVTFMNFLTLTVLMLPSLLLLLVPISLFIAVLFTYNRFIVDSELVVLRGAGLSPWQIAKPALTFAAMIMLLGYALSFSIMPYTYRQFKDMQSFLRDNYGSMLLQEEVFNNPIPGLTVFIHERSSDGILHGILVHDNRVPGAAVTMMAQTGRIESSASGPRFVLEHGNREESKGGQISQLNFDNYTMDISLYANKEKMRVRDPEERYLGELFDTAGMDPQTIAKMRAEAHQRLTWPFYNVTLTLLALAFLLAGQLNRRGQWRRILIATLLGLVIIMAALGLNNVTTKYPRLVPLVYSLAFGMPALLFYVVVTGSEFIRRRRSALALGEV